MGPQAREGVARDYRALNGYTIEAAEGRAIPYRAMVRESARTMPSTATFGGAG